MVLTKCRANQQPRLIQLKIEETLTMQGFFNVPEEDSNLRPTV